MTQFVSPDMSDPAYGSVGFRNLAINGCCRVAQRGSAAVVNNVWTYGGCDRVMAAPGGFTTVSGNIAQGTSGTATASGKVQSMLITTTGSGTVQFGQRIEAANVAQLAGKQLTISAKVYHDVGSTLTTTIALHKANSVDNFSGTTLLYSAAGANAATTVYTAISATFTLTAADVANGLQIVVQINGVGAVTSKTFAIGDLQIEQGSGLSPFELRPYGTEFALCQRYYQQVSDNMRLPAMAFSTTICPATWVFQVAMRAVPTFNSLPGSSTILVGGSNLTVTSLAAGLGSIYGYSTDVQVASGATPGYGAQLRLVGGLMTASAEL